MAPNLFIVGEDTNIGRQRLASATFLEAAGIPEPPAFGRESIAAETLLTSGNLQLMYFPKRTFVWFDLPGLPMPNPREREDLMDVRMDLRNFAEIPISPEDCVEVVAQAAELKLYTSGAVLAQNFPQHPFDWSRLDKSDITPRQLLNEIDRQAPELELVVDPNEFTLTINLDRDRYWFERNWKRLRSWVGFED